MPNPDDPFEATEKATSGPLSGYARWSDAENLTVGAPVDGAGFDMTTGGGDGLVTVPLTSLTRTASAVAVGWLPLPTCIRRWRHRGRSSH